MAKQTRLKRAKRAKAAASAAMGDSERVESTESSQSSAVAPSETSATTEIDSPAPEVSSQPASPPDDDHLSSRQAPSPQLPSEASVQAPTTPAPSTHDTVTPPDAGAERPLRRPSIVTFSPANSVISTFTPSPSRRPSLRPDTTTPVKRSETSDSSAHSGSARRVSVTTIPQLFHEEDDSALPDPEDHFYTAVNQPVRRPSLPGVFPQMSTPRRSSLRTSHLSSSKSPSARPLPEQLRRRASAAPSVSPSAFTQAEPGARRYSLASTILSATPPPAAQPVSVPHESSLPPSSQQQARYSISAASPPYAQLRALDARDYYAAQARWNAYQSPQPAQRPTVEQLQPDFYAPTPPPFMMPSPYPPSPAPSMAMPPAPQPFFSFPPPPSQEPQPTMVVQSPFYEIGGPIPAYTPDDLCVNCNALPQPTFCALDPCDHVVCDMCMNLLINGAAQKPPRPLACFKCATLVETFSAAFELDSYGRTLVNALRLQKLQQRFAKFRMPHAPTKLYAEHTVPPELAGQERNDYAYHSAHSPSRPHFEPQIAPAMNQPEEGIATVRIDNIPWETTFDMVQAWLPENTLLANDDTVLPVHILCNRTDGRTLNQCYIELRDLDAARLVVRQRNGTRLGHRPVAVSLATQAELLTVVFPMWEPGFRGTSAVAGPSGPIVTQTELTGLVNLCRLQTPHAYKCYERPFFNLVTIIVKLPWHQQDKFGGKQCVRILQAARQAIELLIDNVHRVPRWKDIMVKLVESVVFCPAFRDSQKVEMANIAGWDWKPNCDDRREALQPQHPYLHGGKTGLKVPRPPRRGPGRDSSVGVAPLQNRTNDTLNTRGVEESY